MTRLPHGGHPERDARRELRRAQLLDAAVEAIATLGPGATMEQLARQGGVTKPILYRHFRDRQGLITALADRFSLSLMDELDAALAGTADSRELLDSTVDTYLRFIEREPSLYRFLLQHVGDADGLSRISPLIDAIARRVAVTIGDQLRAAGLDSGAAVPWAFGIVGLVHQAGDWWLDDRSMSRQQLVRYLTDLVWSGLEAAAALATSAAVESIDT
ncbi:MAG: TetR family transcriptional regulator [Acidimicrobiales bacterium]|nr:TetR family transcriptional regulator [Acidimicrobiales bacterium]